MVRGNQPIQATAPPWLRASGTFLLLCAFLALPTFGTRNPKPVPTREGRSAAVEALLFLRVPYPKKGGLKAVATKYTGLEANLRALEKHNPQARKKRTASVRIPVELLLPAYRLEALTALLPQDKRVAGGWEHRWGTSPLGEDETWEDLALWMTGSRAKASSLRSANPGAGRKPKKGAAVLVPETLLLKAYEEIAVPKASRATPPQAGPGQGTAGAPPPADQAIQKPPQEAPTPPLVGPPAPPPLVAPPAPPQTPVPEPSGPGLPAPPGTLPPAGLPQDAGAPPLEYGSDERGRYALYRLQAGEALYSAVVVRFTGNVDADEVNALAAEYARRSGIEDVHTIPVGYPVKIPIGDLLPQFLPADDPRFSAWAKKQEEVGRITNTYKSTALEGVVVVLDAGHGGLDRGAMKHGVWEDSYVYDIVCRIREGLERQTKARVLMTVLEPGLGYKPQDKSKLAPNKGAVILTHPWFGQKSREETKVEVNLRWVLTNQYYLRLQKEGIDPHRVVFTSVHADSLHLSLRGSMFYIPGDDYRSERWCVSGPAYEPYAEATSQPCYEVTRKELVRSEGLSLQLARALEKSFASRGLLLHPYIPTRNHVVRGKRSWVPAVLRNTIVPCAVLIEVCNLANKKDAALIAKPAYRQAVADAYIAALVKYYS